MKNKIIAVGLLASACAFAPMASAQDFQVSGGVEYLFDSADSEFGFSMATARAAYFFNETWGIEGEGSFGLSEVNNYSNRGFDFELPNQFGLYGVGRTAAGEKGELFLRVGLRAGTIDAVLGNNSDEIGYNGFSLGAGYTYFLNENFGIRGDITTSGAALDTNFDPDGNFTSAAVSLVYKFGG